MGWGGYIVTAEMVGRMPCHVRLWILEIYCMGPEVWS